MKKTFVFLTLILSLFITGCSSYSITKYFDKDEYYNNSLQYTRKADILDNNDVKAIINATYLNSVDNKFNNDYENFIIGVFIVDDTKEEGLKNPLYTLLLNEKTPISIKELKKEDKLNGVPLRNHWAKYYFVSFDKEKIGFFEERNDDLILSYENKIEKTIYLKKKDLYDEIIENRDTDDELVEEPIRVQKASITFLKEL